MLAKGLYKRASGLGKSLKLGQSLMRCSYSTKKTEIYQEEPMLPDDYPHLPLNNHQRRNPWIYDDQQDRRNFNEPLNEQDEILTVWGPDQYDYPVSKAAFELFFVASTIALGSYIYYFNAPKLDAVRRSFPFDGLREELGNDPSTKENSRVVARSPDSDE